MQDPAGFPGACVWPGPAQAIAVTWGVNQIDDLSRLLSSCVFPSLCHSVSLKKQRNKPLKHTTSPTQYVLIFHIYFHLICNAVRLVGWGAAGQRAPAICWFSPQRPATARAGPGRRARDSISISHLVAATEGFEPPSESSQETRDAMEQPERKAQANYHDKGRSHPCQGLPAEPNTHPIPLVLEE